MSDISTAIEAVGRFGHHPDARTDYECEVDELIGLAYERLTMGSHPDLEDRIARAMEVRTLNTPGELRWLNQVFNGAREIYARKPDWVAWPEERLHALTTRLAPDRDWRCPECRCHTYTDISGSPGMIRCVNCKHVFALTPATAPDREAIAKIVDERAFRSWQSMYDYCIKSGDTPETAKVYADGTHGPEIEKALTKADAILSLMGEG